MWLCLGGVFEDHNTEFAPQNKGTVTIGFDTRDKRIYDGDTKYPKGKRVTGNSRSVQSGSH